MQARSPDTDPEAEKVQIELLRRAGVTRRAQMAVDLSTQVIAMAKRAIRSHLADPTEMDVHLRFVELHYGTELASDLRRFLSHPRS